MRHQCAANTTSLLYDGHGSTRQVAYSDRSLIESYSYDGYGVMLAGTPTWDYPATTNLLYCGEQFDVNCQQYYLRARYYNPLNGLFNCMDPYSGNMQDPQSLHKYAYCHNNPVNMVDPTGQFGDFSLNGLMVNMAIGSMVNRIVMPVLSPVLGKLGFVANILKKLLAKFVNPSALVAGIGSSIRAGIGAFGIGLQGNAELLWSPKTHNAAFYTAFGGSAGNSGAGIMGSIYGGAVYGSPNSENYTGGFFTFTMPLGLIPENIYCKIQSDLASLLVRNIIIKDSTGLDEEMWMRANRTINDNIRKLCRMLKNSAQFELNVFADNPISPKVGGFSVGISGGVMTSPGKGYSLAWTFYSQIWPSSSVSFE